MTLLLTSPLLNSSEKYNYGMKLLFIVKLWMRLLFLKKKTNESESIYMYLIEKIIASRARKTKE